MSKILVVDDNVLNLRLACATLELAGYTTFPAVHGQEAVLIAAAERPDLILMDLRMPVMDGKQAMKLIKTQAHPRFIPIIALTASAMKGEREHLLAEGFDGYIDKPIDIHTLASLLQPFLIDNGTHLVT